MEALALKRPVLATRSSGLAELADQGLIRAIPLRSTPAEVARAVLAQLQDPLVPTEVDLPGWDECTARLHGLYDSILQRTLCAS
jgi:glycosyltransferase involved in cell wall biosynthesis